MANDRWKRDSQMAERAHHPIITPFCAILHGNMAHGVNIGIPRKNMEEQCLPLRICTLAEGDRSWQ